MSTLTVRLKGTGPVGYLRAEVPCSLARLREQMREQGVPAALPEGSEDYRFLTGGLPVSLMQEESEDYQEGDVFIAALPPNMTAAPSTPSSAGVPSPPPHAAWSAAGPMQTDPTLPPTATCVGRQLPQFLARRGDKRGDVSSWSGGAEAEAAGG